MQYAAAFHDLALIREKHPVIHNITNLVVMQTCANLLLSLHASPIMAHAKEELADIATIANALVINIGTLDNSWVESCVQAQQYAIERKLPIIFDPVGVGASAYRTNTAQQLLSNGVTIVRGNASEIIALAGTGVTTKGVDSTHASADAVDAATYISSQYHCTVVVSGKTDIIIQGDRQYHNEYGTPLFTYVTGMGCAATAIIGAFAAVNNDAFLAACHAMIIYTMAGEIAAQKSFGPAAFHQAFIDTLYNLKTPI